MVNGFLRALKNEAKFVFRMDLISIFQLVNSPYKISFITCWPLQYYRTTNLICL